jgi:Leucine-rich repeat (LRR) protein
LWTLKLIGNSFTSIPTTVRNIRQLYELRFIGNPISQLESNLFNGSKIRDLSLGGMANLTRIEDCAFCGLTVWV